MAKHDVGVGLKSQIAGPAGILAAIAVGLCDAVFGITGYPIFSGPAAGIAAWAIAKSEPGAGGGLIVVSIIGIAAAFYSIAS